MKPQLWIPTLVFLVVAVPLVMLLNAIDLGGDYKVWIAIAAGVLVTAMVKRRLDNKKGDAE